MKYSLVATIIRILIFLLTTEAIALASVGEIIHIERTDYTLSELLKTVESQIGIHFSFNPQQVQSNLRLQLQVKQYSLRELLSLLENHYGIYSITKDDVVVLQTRKTKLKTSATLSGTVRDATTGEVLPGAQLASTKGGWGSVSNKYGFYSISRSLCQPISVTLTYLGYEPREFFFSSLKDSTADILLNPQATTLTPVVVTDTARQGDIQSFVPSKHILNMEQVKGIATMGGEPDVMKALQFLPGVQTGNEGTTNFSVRGGSYDQNLFLLDEAPVYNPSHALSFFSVFNTDAVQGLNFYKGAIPVKYGGRLSSVVDVQMKEGSREKQEVSGSIGVIASRLTMEGPLYKNKKLSYMVSGRYSYAGSIVNGLYIVGQLFGDPTSNNSTTNNKINFYDLNAKINYRKDDKNHFYFSSYAGHDNFLFSLLTSGYALNWGNNTVTARWNHVHSSKLFSNTTAVFSNYGYQYKRLDDSRLYTWNARLREIDLKQDYDYYVNSANHISFGGGIESRSIDPGHLSAQLPGASINPVHLEEQKSGNVYLYFSNEYNPSNKLLITYGLRYTNFSVLGPHTQYSFRNGSDTPSDSTYYSRGKIAKSYNRVDPRVAITWHFLPRHALVSSYDRTSQFLHLLSNSSVGTPTDLWFPSSQNVKPQFADIFSLAYQYQSRSHMIEARVGPYYKFMHNVIDFKDNANLFVNPYVESQVLQGQGKSYGTEFFLQKTMGKFQGSASYTWSKTNYTIPGINDGMPYPSRYDKRHNISTTARMKWSKRFESSVNFVFTSGGATTVTSGNFIFDRSVAVNYYTSRNGYRLPNYERIDIGLRFNSKRNDTRRWQQWWALDIYNLTDRKNPFTVFSQRSDPPFSTINNNMIYLFGIIPTISYNFKF